MANEAKKATENKESKKVAFIKEVKNKEVDVKKFTNRKLLALNRKNNAKSQRDAVRLLNNVRGVN